MTYLYQAVVSSETPHRSVGFSRQSFNDSVTAYNTAREKFPTNILANMFNFATAELFIVERAEQKEAPKVSFS